MHSTPIVTSKGLLSLDTTGEVRPYDVICGRYKESYNNIGNRRFRVTIRLSLNRYHVARTKPEKTRYFQSIIAIIQNSGGRFLKWDGQQFIEISNKEKNSKVGHAVRNIVRCKNSRKKMPNARRRSLPVSLDQCGPPPLERCNSDPVISMPRTELDDADASETANDTDGFFVASEFPW